MSEVIYISIIGIWGSGGFGYFCERWITGAFEKFSKAQMVAITVLSGPVVWVFATLLVFVWCLLFIVVNGVGLIQLICSKIWKFLGTIG